MKENRIIITLICSLIFMNIFATSYLFSGLDCGYLISWIPITCSAILNKNKGKIYTTRLLLDINLMICILTSISGILGIISKNSQYLKIFGYPFIISILSTYISQLVQILLCNKKFLSLFIAQFIDNLIFTMLCPFLYYGEQWNNYWIITTIIMALFESLISYYFIRKEYKNGSC